MIIPEQPNPEDVEMLLRTLSERFSKNMQRHPGIDWGSVQKRLEANPSALRSLHDMEATGGEPDVIGHDPLTGQVLFCDCSAESPKGRRSLCYDRAALESRKDFPPAGNAVDMAVEMGIELLSEEQYRALQELGRFDTKTSSWILTPPEIRKLGGATFAEHRYGTVWVFHNGAQSYYAARGFRGILKV